MLGRPPFSTPPHRAVQTAALSVALSARGRPGVRGRSRAQTWGERQREVQGDDSDDSEAPPKDEAPPAPLFGAFPYIHKHQQPI